MMRFGKTALATVTGLVLSSIAANATTSGVQDSPYAGIVPNGQRTCLVLRDPVIVVADPSPKVTALPKITLTGITTILGRRMAFITVPGIKPGEAAESFMLAEGQGVNDIEVKTIDERAGVVNIINHGESQLLDFDHDGVKASASPVPVLNQPILPRPSAPPVNVHTEASLTPEEQVALIEIQRVKFQQENNPIRDLLPPARNDPVNRR